MRNRRFEAWFARRNEIPLDIVEDMWDVDARTYSSRSYHVELAWAAWCTALGFEVEA